MHKARAPIREVALDPLTVFPETGYVRRRAEEGCAQGDIDTGRQIYARHGLRQTFYMCCRDFHSSMTFKSGK